MQTFFGGEFDIAVIGAGHAGCEAALAAARMGQRTLLLCLDIDSVGMMPCNPAIGGTGKGQLVRELDAMGGQMGLCADATLIQMRMLNTGKGPAVHSLRAQIDKRRYHEAMLAVLGSCPKLQLVQGEAVLFLTHAGKISGLVTAEGFRYDCRAIVMAAGVYLKSRILIGEWSRLSGPNGKQRSSELSQALSQLGLPLQRFKTGTPARVKRQSLDFSAMEIQLGDEPPPVFSFLSSTPKLVQEPCHLTYTNAKTHDIILSNLERSPMYSGRISAVGTRYCPSIEDKLVRFRDKDRHQLFIEPEGRNSVEMYVQGMSTSLPGDVQLAMLHSVAGLERCEVTRFGYAIEYDCLDPTALTPYLMARDVPGLFTAGQVNGSSGYEEAAAQGLVAGINAALYNKEETPLVLERSMGYIGVLIDDLTTKGTPEPYRMMTSRCEYRLLLRQDNADLRLTELARRTGLISAERMERMVQKRDMTRRALERLGSHVPPTEALCAYLESLGESVPKSGVSLMELLKRPRVSYTALAELFSQLEPLPAVVLEQVELEARYGGYLAKQQEQVQREKALEGSVLPTDIDYLGMEGLRLEARQKLNAIRPLNVGQASRISGVSPADISVLLIHIKRRGWDKNGA